MPCCAYKLAFGKTACHCWLNCVQERLKEKGVAMAVNGGFQVIDTHKNKQMLSVMVNSICYIGYMDAVVVPYGSGNYAQDMRMGVEFKQNAHDKLRYEKDFGKDQCSCGIVANAMHNLHACLQAGT